MDTLGSTKVKAYRNNEFGGGGTKKLANEEKIRRVTEQHRVPGVGACVLINTQKPRVIVGEERDYGEINQERFFGIVEKEDRNGKIYIKKYSAGKPEQGFRSQYIKPKRYFSYGVVRFLVLNEMPTKKFTYEEMDIELFGKIAAAYIELLPEREYGVELM